MKRIRLQRTIILSVPLLLLGVACSSPATRIDAEGAARTTPASSRTGDTNARRIAFDETMRRHGIAGAQLIYSHGGEHEEHDYGVMSDTSGKQVASQTVFQAASLSKVIAAYIALRLVDQGRIDLDTPLWNYWPSPRTKDNDLARKITTRMVLNHTTGLPNWQISPSNSALDSTPLVSEFPPGARFQYSGEGFYLLQKTIEHVTGLGWNELAEKEVFARFDMRSSSYLTKHAFDEFNAPGHRKDGSVLPDRVFAKENTAWTLTTNAHDYDNFIQKALYRGEGLAPAMRELMFAVSSNADDLSVPSPADPFISWGLGLGIQTTQDRKLVWHWGDNPGFKALFVLDPRTGDSIVLLTNSENGLSTYQEVLHLFMGAGEYPAVDWARAQS